jgi:hypothetical protein
MSNDWLKLQETLSSKAILTIFYKKMVSARQIRHLWVASDTALSLLSKCANQTLSFDPYITQVQQR